MVYFLEHLFLTLAIMVRFFHPEKTVSQEFQIKKKNVEALMAKDINIFASFFSSVFYRNGSLVLTKIVKASATPVA
jgi:hypothetical protein